MTDEPEDATDEDPPPGFYCLAAEDYEWPESFFSEDHMPTHYYPVRYTN